jgi:hypothetical protein
VNLSESINANHLKSLPTRPLLSYFQLYGRIFETPNSVATQTPRYHG